MVMAVEIHNSTSGPFGLVSRRDHYVAGLEIAIYRNGVYVERSGWIGDQPRMTEATVVKPGESHIVKLDLANHYVYGANFSPGWYEARISYDDRNSDAPGVTHTSLEKWVALEVIP